MAKLKGVKELESVLNSFAEQFDCEVHIDSDFWVDIHTNTVYFGMMYSEDGEKEFMASVERCRPAVEMNISLWSFLHEIFHIETYDDLTDEELNYCVDMKNLIQQNKIDESIYYDLPIERLATQAAVEYANNHINELYEFWKKLQPAIMNFYRLNNIY